VLRNYLTVAWRNLVRHKLYSLINVLGLAVGMACGILVFLLLRFEWTYDAFHEKADRIYRVYASAKNPDGTWVKSVISYPLPPLEDQFPEVVHTLRLQQSAASVNYQNSLFTEVTSFVDPEFFAVFSFPFQYGDPETALNNPNSAVITAEAARRFFGNENPLGKTLSLFSSPREFVDVVVSGVLKEIPGNSSIQSELFLPADRVSSSPRITGPIFGGGTFVQLAEGARAEALEAKLPRILGQLGQSPETYQLRLQPLSQIHSGADIPTYLLTARDFDFHDGLRGKSNPAYIWILASMGLIVLVMACINFTTLAIGRASTRTREIGVRKVTGALREQLIQQFLGEAMLLSTLALVLGVVLAEWCLPYFSELVRRKLVLDYTADLGLLAGLTALALCAGLLAGIYPAIALSGFHPVSALRGTLSMRATNPFGRTLLVLQFTISTFFLTSTLVMIAQVRLLRTTDLGFDAEQVIVLPRWTMDLEAYVNEISENPLVRSVALSTPSMGNYSRLWNDSLGVELFSADYNYLETLGIELVEGRNFSRNLPLDETSAIIINETMAKKWGWDHPLGRQLTGFHLGNAQDPVVIGVVKDFHQFSLFAKIPPTVICLNAVEPDYLSVRVDPKGKAAALAFLRATWERISPELSYAFRPVLLDEHFSQYYREEERWERLLIYTSSAALFLSGLGALGLTSLSVARRTKEIGIRKVLGASVPGIVMLLSKEFTCLVLAANLIAWPVAWYAMSRWLENFAYRIELGPGVFVLGGVLALLIAWLTVSFQAIRAARANPVEALRYE
jgi:putative ABC transport system permease protein